MLFYRLKVTPTATSVSGTTAAITVFADAGGGQVTVTSNGHGLSTGTRIGITGTTNYNGAFTIANALVNTFEITATWVANDATGDWNLADGTWSARLSDMLPSGYKSVQPRQLQFPPMLFRQVYCKAATVGNVYDLTITDYEDIQIRRFIDVSQIANDLTETPIVGDVTFTVTGSDLMEGFTLLAIVQDDR